MMQINKTQLDAHIRSPIAKQIKIDLNPEMNFLNNQASNIANLNINTTKKKLNVANTGNINLTKNSDNNNNNLLTIMNKNKEEYSNSGN